MNAFPPLLVLMATTLLLAGVPSHAAQSRGTAPLDPGLAPVLAHPGVVAPGVTQPAAAPTALPQPGVARAIPGGMRNAPLAGEIRLGAGQMFSLNLRSTVVFISFDTLQKQVAQFLGHAGQYESGAKTMQAVAKSCANKAYSVQDQKNAGCGGTETLDQCTAKLFKHCVKTYAGAGGGGAGPSSSPNLTSAQASSPGNPLEEQMKQFAKMAQTGQQNTLQDLAGQVKQMQGGGAAPGFSTAQFQQSAQKTATQARTLAQQLNQYASQVEQNAQALLP